MNGKAPYRVLDCMKKFGRLTLNDLIEEIHKPEDAQEVFKRLANQKAFHVSQLDRERISK